MQFTVILLHFQCTLTLHIYSVMFCTFKDQENTALPMHFNLHIYSVMFCSFNDNKEKVEKVFFFHQNVPCWRRVKLILGLPCLPTWIMKRFNPYNNIEFIRWFHEFSVTTNLQIFQETDTNSLVNADSFYANFANIPFKKIPVPHLTHTIKQKFLH